MILVFIFNVSLITSIYRMFYKWHHQYFLCYFFHFLWHIYNLYFNVFCFQWIYASLLLLFSFTNNSKWYPDSWLWCFCWSTVHLAVFFSSKRNISSHIHGFTWMSDEMFLLLKLGFPYLGYWASIRNPKWAWYSPKNCLSFLLHCLNSLLKQENCCFDKLSSRNCIMVWIYLIQCLCVSLNILRWA